jgi:hypothetical protein
VSAAHLARQRVERLVDSPQRQKGASGAQSGHQEKHALCHAGFIGFAGGFVLYHVVWELYMFSSKIHCQHLISIQNFRLTKHSANATAIEPSRRERCAD